ncbi:MAG TPA: M14 family zinc carboxypeptidase [bacterium]|nr:M14 family zinc carboxypeptidase [bacterium]
MRLLTRIILVIPVLLAVSPVIGGQDNLSFVSIRVAPMEREPLKRFPGMDITAFDDRNGIIEGIARHDEIEQYRSAGYQVETLITDMDAFYRQLRDSQYFARFHSYPQMLAEMQQLAESHPEIVMLQDIGDSYDKIKGRGGYDIWALKISDQVETEDSTEADVLFGANIHAREIITPEIIMTFIHYLVDNYYDDPWVHHLVDNREIWLIPSINPDGHEFVLTGNYYGDLVPENPLIWRKNMSDNDEDSLFNPLFDGVDLNRNFGYEWGYDNIGSSAEYYEDTFRGFAPFSEPETQVIRDFVNQHQFVTSLIYHSYSRVWLYPWEHAALDPPEPDLSAFKALADSCVAYNGYAPGNTASGTIYPVNGGADDWLYGEKHIFSFTPEVGSRDQGMFWPDTSFIAIQIAENLGPNLYMTYAAGEEPIIKDRTFKDYKQPGDQYTIIAAIKPPIRLTGPAPLDTASFRVCYRYNNSTHIDTLPLLKEPALDLFTADIPGADSIYVIHYYIQAQDSLGRSGFYPRGAPAAMDTLTIEISNVIQDYSAKMAQEYSLIQNYPNPFNAQTKITFSVAQSSPVKIVIYNHLGQQVRELANDTYPAGTHRVVWNGTDAANHAVASGIYFCVLQSGEQRLVQKMTLLR